MGWAFCGKDSRGREMGYGVTARCDHVWGGRRCHARIDRGLAYACGGMHEGGQVDLPNGMFWKTCGGYFCPAHLYVCEEAPRLVCRRCVLRAVVYARSAAVEAAT